MKVQGQDGQGSLDESLRRRVRLESDQEKAICVVLKHDGKTTSYGQPNDGQLWKSPRQTVCNQRPQRQDRVGLRKETQPVFFCFEPLVRLRPNRNIGIEGMVHDPRSKRANDSGSIGQAFECKTAHRSEMGQDETNPKRSNFLQGDPL